MIFDSQSLEGACLMAAGSAVTSQWGTTTDAASSATVSTSVRAAIYHATVGKVQSILSSLAKFEPKDLNEVNRSYQGGPMRIPFTLGSEVTAEQMHRIERELSDLHATVSVANDISGPQLIVAVDPKHALETAKRLKSLRSVQARSAGCSLFLCVVIALMAAAIYIHFSISAAAKIDFVRTYVPAAEPFLRSLAGIFQGAASASSQASGLGANTNGST